MEGMLEQDESIDSLVQLVLMRPPVTEQMRACQAPKPVLFPKDAQPPLPIGVAKLGQLALVFVPSEVTTMSGRRMRETIRTVFGDEVSHVVIAGYSNDYAGYITTPEEYAVQQYEGGHTLFGPWTLPGFRQELARLARALADGRPAPASEEQGDLRGEVDSQPVGNDFDEPPEQGVFGEVTAQPESVYAAGETVSTSFWTGHPDNAPLGGAPYVEVQRQGADGWTTIATEADWSTQARWTQASRVIPPYDPLDPFAVPPPPINEAFTVSIRWQIPADIEPGTYRVLLHGSEKPQGANAKDFVAETGPFDIIEP
jgi:neutral ceramidase